MQAFVTGGSGFLGGRLVETMVDRGDSVAALARSASSARAVEGAGATPVSGDLSDVEAMTEGMADCDVAFHLAAKVDDWGDPEEFERVNVQGTENVLEAARRAGVDRVVHTSTEGVLGDGSALRNVDETHPIPDEFVGLYPRTKAAAERMVTDADGTDLTTVVLRFPIIWGAGDTNFLPGLLSAVEADRFVWFGDGYYPKSKCHVDNAVEGFLCAADEGRGGEVYFVTDGDPVEFRPFVLDLLETQGVDPSDRSVPLRLAWWGATVAEAAWRYLPLSGDPPLTRTVLATICREVTIDDGKARRELGYEGHVSMEDGIEELREDEPTASTPMV